MSAPRSVKIAALSTFTTGFLELFWPLSCPLCGLWWHGGEREGPGGAAEAETTGGLHPRSLAGLPTELQLPKCRPAFARRGQVQLLWLYKDSPAFFRLLHAAKYGHRPSLLNSAGKALGSFLAGWWGSDGRRAVLHPLPDDPLRRRERGYGVTTILAEAIARELPLPMRQDLLTRKRASAPQAKLDRPEDRAANVRGLFGVGRLAEIESSTTVILVEDQITTGATMVEAAQIASCRGNPVVGVALAGSAHAPRELVLDTTMA